MGLTTSPPTPYTNRGVNPRKRAEMFSYPPTKIEDIGVDWLTLTTPDKVRQGEWQEAFESVAAGAQARGYKWADSRLLGYLGSSCGHAFLGRREDASNVPSTGDLLTPILRYTNIL